MKFSNHLDLKKKFSLVILFLSLLGFLEAAPQIFYVKEAEDGVTKVTLQTFINCSGVSGKNYLFQIAGEAGQNVYPKAGNFSEFPVITLTPDDTKGDKGRSFSLHVGEDRNKDLTLQANEICFNGKVIPVKVQILRKAGIFPSQNITGKIQDETAGRKVSLIAKVLPSNLSVESWQWSIPGTRVKGYEASAQTGRVQPVGQADLTSPEIIYYWAKSGEAMEVEQEVRVGGKSFSAKTTFNVKAPETKITWRTGTIEIRPFFPGSETIYLLFGSSLTGEVPGFLAGREMTGPSAQTQWVQLLKSRRVRRNDSGVTEVFEGQGLDNDYPYDKSPLFRDSPGQQLRDNDVSLSIEDDFDLWLMGRPSGNDSIWIPLMKIKWGWRADAQKNGNKWGLISSTVKEVTVEDAAEYPEWNTNISDFDWKATP